MTTQAKEFHRPVLLREVIEALQIQPDIWYVDATAGGGGHAQAILEKRGRVLAIDQDQDAIDELERRFVKEIAQKRIIVAGGNFRKLQELVEKSEVREVAGILLDLGLSTYQIKQSGRGFSFSRDELLDMRMSRKDSITAGEIVNQFSMEDLQTIFMRFGEERLSYEIAQKIVQTREKMKLVTTKQLQELVSAVYQNARIVTHINPATLVFQALRIAVNRELESLREVLPQAHQLLLPKGRLAIISFHSLEDRIVKQEFKRWEKGNLGKIVTKKPIIPTEVETRVNPAARSAKLRIFEKASL